MYAQNVGVILDFRTTKYLYDKHLHVLSVNQGIKRNFVQKKEYFLQEPFRNFEAKAIIDKFASEFNINKV